MVAPNPETPRWPNVDCLGVRVAQPTWDELKSWFFASAQPNDRRAVPGTLSIVNAHTLNLAFHDQNYRDVLNRSDVVLNDGLGLDLYGRLAGAPFAYNFNGTDLFPRLFREANVPIRVFLYGGAQGRADRAATVIESRYPNVRVVGARHGFIQESAVEAINAANPDVLLVGLGNPRQELWIDERRDQLHVGVAAGVGALIDFFSGAVPRAPELVRRVRMEWAYRLAREPRRLFRRYVLGNPVFLFRSARYLASRRRRSGL